MASGSYPAKAEALPQLLEFAEEQLEQAQCPMDVTMRLCIAIEEIFINICHYAYPEGWGEVTFCVTREEQGVTLLFEDSGIPFDPLAKADADPQAMAESEKIGGLGIHIVKKTMDQLHYCYQEGKNKLTLKKYW